MVLISSEDYFLVDLPLLCFDLCCRCHLCLFIVANRQPVPPLSLIFYLFYFFGDVLLGWSFFRHLSLSMVVPIIAVGY